MLTRSFSYKNNTDLEMVQCISKWLSPNIRQQTTETQVQDRHTSRYHRDYRAALGLSLCSMCRKSVLEDWDGLEYQTTVRVNGTVYWPSIPADSVTPW